MFNSNLMSNNLKLLNLTSTNISGSNLNIDSSVNFRSGLFYLNSNNRIGVLKTNPQYTLDISGDINFTGNIYNNGTIVTTETASTSLWSNASGYIYFNGGNVGIGTSTNNLPYLFYVNGTSYFVSQAIFNSLLSVNSTITCNDIIVSDTTMTKDLDATGITTLNGLESSSVITTNGLVNNSGNINIVSGDINAPNSTITCSNFYSTNQGTFASNVTFEENVSILGKLNCVDNFNINNKLLIYGSSGNIITTGSGSFGNSVSIESSLNVNGFTELNKTKINNDLEINGNLNVVGSSGFEDITVNNITTLNNNLSVDADNFFVNTTGSQVSIGYLTPSTSTNSGALVVSGGVGIEGNLNVNYGISSSSGTSEFNQIIVSDNLEVAGETILYSDLQIYGLTTISNDLVCELPGGTITALTGLNVGSNSSPSGPALTVNSSGNLSTVGNIQLDQNLTVGGNILTQGNLNLSGIGNFFGGMVLNSRFIQDNVSTYNLVTSYSGSTFVIVSHNTLSTIYLPINDIAGSNYKFVIGPGYVSGVGNIITIQINPMTFPALSFFGLVDNNGTYLSISSATTITLNSNACGDFIEILCVIVDSSGLLGYYINCKSSQSNGFIGS